MKFMYEVALRKPNDVANYVSYHGGDTPEEAQATAVKTQVEFHNQWNKEKLTAADITVASVKLQGDYQAVLRDLERG